MRRVRFGLLAALPVLLALPARADSRRADLMTPDGTLLEVVSAKSSLGSMLVLRSTRPDGWASADIVEGSLDSDLEGVASLDYDSVTKTVFVVFTKMRGYHSDINIAVRRDGRWISQNILPNAGLYSSKNPRLLVTRQKYTDVDKDGQRVPKTRSVVSVVWWEESSYAQARYACLFVEDGVLNSDGVRAFDLNALHGVTGPTPASGLPFSSYQYPDVVPDPGANGGVLVSFVNLAAQKHCVIRITFPDDISKLLSEGSKTPDRDSYVRAHIPISRGVREGAIPVRVDVRGESVRTLISPEGMPTFYWEEPSSLRFVRGDATPDLPPTTISIRDDFNIDRALSLLRQMAERH